MTPRILSAALALGVMAFAIGSARAADAYKDATNPTGVPDISQGNGDFCFPTSWTDALWWFNQSYPALADTAAGAQWKAEAESVRDKVIALQGDGATASTGHKGVIKYIREVRPKDFPDKPKPTDPRWGVVYHYPRENKVTGSAKALPPSDIGDIIASSLGNPHRFTLLVLGAQKKDSATNFDYIPGFHAVAASGLTTDNDGKVTHVIISNPWGDHPVGTDPNQPVHQSFYDKHAVDLINYNDPKISSKYVRITDAALIAAAPPWKDKAKWVDVPMTTTLVDDFVGYYRFNVKKEGQGPQSESATPQSLGSPADTYICEHTLSNTGDTPLEFFTFEIPGVTASNPLSLGDLVDLQLPVGWSITTWNPNDTQTFTPPNMEDNDVRERDYRGLFAFATSDAFWLPSGQDLTISFKLNGGLFDPLADDASFAVANFDLGLAGESLGVPVPEPMGAMAFALAAMLAASRRRRV